jgi:serine/threonine protein kinase
MYPQVFGKYVLERELARGGMARVVLATLRGAGGFEKKLVVKQIRDELACDDDFVRRFVEEAKTTVALAHPNIVPVYELGVELGTYFLAMEYVEGASLAELLRAVSKEGKGLSPEEGAYVGVEVCRALDYAHRRMNVVHRDVTPRNVMVDDEGQVKVIDFGISTPVATAPTGQGVFGSPGHMPPEQMEGTELTPAADVFAVAVLLMELWSGKAPFRRHTKEDIDAAMKGPHPKPSDIDIRLLPLDDVIASAMALDAKVRPQQAEDLARALRRFLTGTWRGSSATASRPCASTRSRPRTRKSRCSSVPRRDRRPWPWGRRRSRRARRCCRRRTARPRDA